MAGRKRAAAESDPAPTTRASKTAKTGGGAAGKGKKGAKANLTAAAFKSHALPLHVTLTHTPPAVAEDESTAPAHAADPGFIGSLTMTPSSLSTGSYGWKCNKRITIEVDNPEGGEKEKMSVQLTFNATVVGSKGKGDEEEGKEEERIEGEIANGDKADSGEAKAADE